MAQDLHTKATFLQGHREVGLYRLSKSSPTLQSAVHCQLEVWHSRPNATLACQIVNTFQLPCSSKSRSKISVACQ
ncbi:hypothetical protein AXF42_Ash012764 [Apostasia shenzhenica]|uniref:Uncharacterized protein n=1 Tax=Apostasia shenzhenica TaxID=1088818 RepID=A0A2I0AM71_9ASPA|nr:hypothetical protein AXF42_Ash012764 [Apostasia shenzhenica]